MNDSIVYARKKTRKTYIFGKMNIISEKITMKKYVNSGVGKFLQ